MKKAPTLAEASPYKSVAQELETLRGMFRLACRQYSERVETEIIRVREQVVAAGALAAEREKGLSGKAGAGPSGRRPSSKNGKAATLSQVHDLRDMLTLLRTMQIRPQEGRRKDLKKIESIISDLELLTAGWSPVTSAS